jgi:hypothetical protein
MLTNKHYEMLGVAIRQMGSTQRMTQITEAEMGRVIMNMVRILEREAERDSREEYNRLQGSTK